MSSTKSPVVEYYFVPLGREPGGYLDFLRLRPDADADTVAAKEAEYRVGLKNELRKQRGVLLEQKKAKLITEEEYRAKLEERNATNDKELADFQQLKQKFELLQAERRKLANDGRPEMSSAWAEAYASFGHDPAKFWQFLLAARPLPQVEAEVLEAIGARWLKPAGRETVVGTAEPEDVVRDVLADQSLLAAAEIKQREKWLRTLQQRELEWRKQILTEEVKRKDKTRAEAQELLTRRSEEMGRAERAFQQLRQPVNVSPGGNPASAASARWKRLSQFRLFLSDTVDLSTVRGLRHEQELIRLLLADALWSELRGTHRDFWSNQIGTWAKEVGNLGPRLRLEHNGPPVATRGGDYPVLSQLADRTIDRLEAKDLGDLSQEPERRGGPPDLSDPMMAAFLRALLAADQKRSANDDESSANGEAASDSAAAARAKLEELRALFELLGRSQGGH